MKLSKFKFNLPQELIALHPAKNRDESRLMVVDRRTGEIEHKVFKDLLGYFGEKDVFIYFLYEYTVAVFRQGFFLPVCTATRKRPELVSKFFCCVS